MLPFRARLLGTIVGAAAVAGAGCSTGPGSGPEGPGTMVIFGVVAVPESWGPVAPHSLIVSQGPIVAVTTPSGRAEACVAPDGRTSTASVDADRGYRAAIVSRSQARECVFITASTGSAFAMTSAKLAFPPPGAIDSVRLDLTFSGPRTEAALRSH